MKSFPLLKTERLNLRALSMSDTDSIYAMRTNPELNKYIDRKPLERKDEAIEFIGMIQKLTGALTTYFWAIEEAGAQQFAGTICLWNFSSDRLTAEIGYELLPLAQNQGIMSEALKRVIDFGFDELNLLCIKAFTHRENLPSKRLLLKFGFESSEVEKDSDVPSNEVFTLNRD